jgi:hypothetical protein
MHAIDLVHRSEALCDSPGRQRGGNRFLLCEVTEVIDVAARDNLDATEVLERVSLIRRQVIGND